MSKQRKLHKQSKPTKQQWQSFVCSSTYTLLICPAERCMGLNHQETKQQNRIVSQIAARQQQDEAEKGGRHALILLI